MQQTPPYNSWMNDAVSKGGAAELRCSAAEVIFGVLWLLCVAGGKLCDRHVIVDRELEWGRGRFNKVIICNEDIG
jgi:hypothetical protein